MATDVTIVTGAKNVEGLVEAKEAEETAKHIISSGSMSPRETLET